MEEKRVTREPDAEMSRQALIRVKDKPSIMQGGTAYIALVPSGQGRFLFPSLYDG